jgi:RNA polymerase sigma factor (sigma-70 family)
MRDDPVVVDLVARAIDGDADAWKELVRRYASLVWAICKDFRLNDADCQDIGQAVWLRLLEALPILREPAALPGWLATTTRRECLRLVDQARRQRTVELQPEFDSTPEEQPPPEQHLVAAELDAALRAAFAELEPRCQELLILLIQRPRVPYIEIGERMGIATGSVGPIRARCLTRLRQCPALAAWIADHEDEEGR